MTSNPTLRAPRWTSVDLGDTEVVTLFGATSVEWCPPLRGHTEVATEVTGPPLNSKQPHLGATEVNPGRTTHG